MARGNVTRLNSQVMMGGGCATILQENLATEPSVATIDVGWTENEEIPATKPTRRQIRDFLCMQKYRELICTIKIINNNYLHLRFCSTKSKQIKVLQTYPSLWLSWRHLSISVIYQKTDVPAPEAVHMQHAAGRWWLEWNSYILHGLGFSETELVSATSQEASK